MKYNCDLISDLLPLYKDEICSEASRKIVEEHLAECPDCKKMLNSLNDVTIDEKIVKEKEEVIGTQAKFFKRKSALAGSIIGLIFSIPILVCLIVNLATGNLTSVGTLLATGQQYLFTYPHMILFPSIFISLLMLSFNLFGNGLRDAFNPTLRGTEE